MLNKKIFLIIISIFLTVAGFINQGGTGYFLAIPFIFYLIAQLINRKNHPIIRFVIGAIFLICASLHYLKENEHKLFFPKNDEVVFLDNDFCSERDFGAITVNQNNAKNDCPKENFFKKGSSFKILRTYVSNADFGEDYHLILKDLNTKRSITYYSVTSNSFNNQGISFSLANGERITEKHVRNELFYKISLIFSGPLLIWNYM